MSMILGSGVVGSVGGVETGGGLVTVASISTAPKVSLGRRGSEGSSSGVSSVGAVVGSGVSSGCAGCSLTVVVCGSAWGGASKVMGKGVAASVASGMGMDTESEAYDGVGVLSGCAATTTSPGGVGPVPSGELFRSSTVSIGCCPVASLSVSCVWSWWAISTSAAPYSSKICATSSKCWSARA